mgnify:CR=1 FL=1
MSYSVEEEARPPYAPFLALSRFWKGIVGAGTVGTVIAFGFVSASIQLGGGGSGWPLHDVLHPLLGLFLGPVYGPLCSVLGAAVSEVVTPYTALGGLSPLMGGVAALSTGLLVQERRGWRGLWGLIFVLHLGYLVIGRRHDVSYLLWAQATLPVTGSLVLSAIPAVRLWWRRHLTPASWSWHTAGALYVIMVVGGSFGILPVWVVTMLTDPFSVEVWRAVTPIVYAERLLFPFVGTVLGMALWPALRRGPFSIANQLRYGLPICILLTFFFAGRLFVEQAYDDAQAEALQQIRSESRAAARAVDAELTKAVTLLRNWQPSAPAPASHPFFRRVERVPDTMSPSDSLAADVRSLLDSARATGRVQRGFVALPDTAAHSVALAVPAALRAGTATADLVAYLAPNLLRQTLAIWDQSPSCLYLLTESNMPVVERRRDNIETAPSPLVEALRRASDSTAHANRGRYGTNVLGARVQLSGLSGSVVVERAREDAYFHVFEMLLSMAFVSLVASGGALAVGFYLSRRVVDPLDRLIEAARRVGRGELSTRVTVEQDNELGELADAFNTMTEDLDTSVQRLQANEERLRMALDAAQMGTWTWTASTGTLRWSPQTYALLGVPEARSNTLPAAYLARVHPEDRRGVVRKVDAILRSGSDFEFEHRIRPEWAEERWVKVKGRVLRRDDQPQHMSGIVMDITARKEAERELVAAKEEAEEMSRLKSAFLANVSHEIRTPLTSIIGFAEVLADEVGAEQEGLAEKIVQSGRRLKTTLDSVLDLSMIESGEFTLDCQAFDLAEEVRRRTDLLRSQAEREGLDFSVDAPAEGPEVYLDLNCLDRILTNLLSNAIKFTEEGEVSVRIREEGSHVVLQVCDTGIGIDEDFLPDLFEAFKQESEGLQREHEGTGLGLSITKELVDLMEGEIAVVSEKGEGTTFTVRLPRQVSGEG